MNRLASLAQIKQYRPKPLSANAHQKLARQLKSFVMNKEQTHLKYTFEFDTSQYNAVLDKMTRIGSIADDMDHHPEWTLSGNKLQVGLGTHQIGGKVSIKDYILASWIQTLWSQRSLQSVLTQEWNKRKIDHIQQLN